MGICLEYRLYEEFREKQGSIKLCFQLSISINQCPVILSLPREFTVFVKLSILIVLVNPSMITD